MQWIKHQQKRKHVDVKPCILRKEGLLMKIKMKNKKRILSSVTALMVGLSALYVPQGTMTVYAEEQNNTNETNGITVAVDTQNTSYSPTQIVNGNFETSPWESFVVNGITYTKVTSPAPTGSVNPAIPNGVGKGWNTTETSPYQGSLFEVWNIHNLPADKDRTFPAAIGEQFIEMNANNPAALYQDLPTKGGDVIKWTLQHAARNGHGFNEQRMYVTVGAPERDSNDQIVAATGVSDSINTKIQDAGMAKYCYDGTKEEGEKEFVEGSTGFFKAGELKGLSVLKTDSNWHDVAGIYIVPEGQEVTRFAFCADSTSKMEGENNSLSGGNFLDNITFSTLIGDLKATKQSGVGVKITGYWGETDENKNLYVQILDSGENVKETHEIDMKSVGQGNFVITVPESKVSDSDNIKIYHQDYPNATKTITVSHQHEWQYEVDSNKLYAYCSSTTPPVCAWGAAYKMPLTLNVASEVTYSGEPYVGAYLTRSEKTAWETAGLKVPPIQYEGREGTNYGPSSTPPTNVGTYTASITAGITEDAKTVQLPFTISQKSLTAPEMSVAINPNTYTYDGGLKTPAVIVKDGYKVLTSDDYTLSGDITQSSVSGSNDYKITVTGKGNYKDIVYKSWTITKGSMQGLIKNEYNGIYDGNPHSSTVSVTTPISPTITYSTTAEDGSYTDTLPEYTDPGSHTIYYKIEKEGYTTETGQLTVTIRPIITLQNDGHGTVTASVDGAPVTSTGEGKEVTLTATPNEGYRFKQWSVSDNAVTITDNKFTMPNKNITISAEFEVIPSTPEEPETPGTPETPGIPSVPVVPTNPTENYTIPVKNENTLQVEAQINGGSAKVSEITEDIVSKLVNSEESKVDTITVDLSGVKKEITSVKLSKASVETLAKATKENKNGIDTVTIELTKAQVELDNKTLETLATEAKGKDIELVVEDKEREKLNNAQQETLSKHQVAATFEAYFVSGGERIHDFKGGCATIGVDFTPEAGKDTNYYHMIYVAENGEVTRYKTKYQAGKILFTTTHFSDYAIIYDDTEKNETEEKETEQPVTPSTVVDFGTLRARSEVQTVNSIVVKWNKVSQADGYLVYGSKCNTRDHKYTMKLLKTIPNNNTLNWTNTKLAKGTYYKYKVRAYKLVNGKKVIIGTSVDVHAVTKGGKYGVAKRVELVSLGGKKNTNKLTLAAGKTAGIVAKEIKVEKPIRFHRDLRYESSNKKVATVTKEGKITAVSKGTCYIYIYAQNGVYKTVKITVK